jgi:hypothetical protein
MTTMGRTDVLSQLRKLGFEPSRAYRVIEIAQEYGESREPIADGSISVKRAGGSTFYVEINRVNPSVRNRPVQVAQSSDGRYSSSTGKKGKADTIPGKQRSRTMPRKAAVTEPEVDETDEAPDYTVYADKDITPTMEDFHEWLEQEVGIELDLRSVALGGTLRMEFQKSQFNKDRRAQRQAERAAGNGASENEDEAPTPRRGRGKAAAEPKDETPAPARRGRQAAAASSGKTAPSKGAGKASAATPAPSRRGRRPAAAAAATGEAPF